MKRDGRDAVPDLGGLRPFAILVGWTADFFGTSFTGPLLFIGFGADPSDPSAFDRLNAAPDFLLASLVFGLAWTVVGGFVAAHLAPGAERPNALAEGVASAASGLVLALTSDVGPSVWYLALATALTIPAAMLGGYARERTRGAHLVT